MKSKTTAVVLAIFFGCFTFLYTWDNDYDNFFTFMGLTIVSLLIFPPAALIINIFIIIKVARRDANWYKNCKEYIKE